MPNRLTVILSSGTDLPRVVTVQGVLTWQTSQSLWKALQPLLKPASGDVVVDLAAVTSMDSSAVAVLLEGARWARNDGCTFALQGVGNVAQDQFELAKVRDVFVVREAA